MDGSEDGERRVDAETLRYLAGLFGQRREIAGTSLFPKNRQETLVVELDTAYYPEAIDSVRLEIRLYTNGEFHCSYLETYLGEQRQCRWDRHDQNHSSEDHFHPIPAASTANAEDKTYPTDVTALLETVVLPWLEERLGILWAKQDDS